MNHKPYLDVLRALRALPGVKKVFVRSGVRFDYVMADSDDTFLRELSQYHVSGQLRVAPEHVSDAVLYAVIGKPKNRSVPGVLQEVRSHKRQARAEEAVRGAVFDELASGVYAERGH